MQKILESVLCDEMLPWADEARKQASNTSKEGKREVVKLEDSDSESEEGEDSSDSTAFSSISPLLATSTGSSIGD